MAHGSRPATQQRGWAWCAIAAVLFGAATPATKLLVDDIDAVALAGLLYLGAATAVAPFARQRPQRRPTTSDRSRLLLAVAVGGGLGPVLLVLALNRAPATQVSLFLNLELVATAVIARLFLREHIGHRAAVGIGLVVVGGAVLTGAGEAGVATGALLVAAACLCWGVDNAVTASLDAYSPTRITLTKGLIAGTVNVALATALSGPPPIAGIVAAMAIGALGYGMSITLWITGARLVGAARGQAVFSLAPFVGALLAWPIDDTRPDTATITAFGVSLVGVALIGTARHRHRHRHEPVEHAHRIDHTDPHHADGAIEVVAGDLHRHLALTHEHDHLPDVHHRHRH